MKSRLLSVFMMLVAPSAWMQNQAPSPPGDAPPAYTYSTQSNLVLVPALVTTRTGEVVFALSERDFAVTDNGVEQRATLNDDADQQPLALAVVIQTGGVGREHLHDLGNLAIMLEGMVGAIPHEVAVVSFDRRSHLVQDSRRT